MFSHRSEDEAPPPILGSWRNLYLLQVIVLVGLIVAFGWIGSHYG